MTKELPLLIKRTYTSSTNENNFRIDNRIENEQTNGTFFM